jgi:antitoxin component YwqK of YwqJK toxin-antitoxin module
MENRILGKRYYLVTFSHKDINLEVKYERPGHNCFKRFYPDGRLAEEGECLVELYNAGEPIPDESDVLWSKSYKPDGTLGSEVKNGTGTQIYWNANGIKIWELELADFKRVRHSKWYANGQLQGACDYVDGSMDGPYVSYYPSGAKQTEGMCSKGHAVGKWIWYNEDGGISKIEDYTVEAKQ